MVDERIMAGEIALTVAALIIIFSATCGSLQPVPDGLVYTEIQKTLVHGIQGVLTCRFYGEPWAVYWDKGHDPENLSPLLLWHVGAKSGPRYSDGSCDIDDNYSLIIKNVSTADAGRIYCTVSNYIGILIDNYTDVSVADAAIETNARVTLQMIQATYGILQCTVHIKARRVSWRKGITSSANESLVVLENNQGVSERSGAGYDDGTYNITHDYSLVIKELQVHHEGLYICEVTDFDTGISFRNHSCVNVVARPLKPFPTIQECLNTKHYGSNYCTLVAKSGMTITCAAMKYYPAINLIFLHGPRIVEPLDTREWNNTDGTKNKTLTIAASGSKELYTCVASNIPGTSDNKSTSVLLHVEEKFKSVVLVNILILFAALILVSSVAYVIWRKRRLNYSPVPRSAPQQELEDFDVNIKELTKKELQALEKGVSRVLMKHCRMIYDAIEREPVQAEKIIHGNKAALFHTNRMLIDWQQRLTSTNSQYKRAYQHTYIVAPKSGPAIGQAWPSNEELRSISHHLKQEYMKEICTKLQIDYKPDDANDDEKRFDSLCEWRGRAADTSLKEKFMQLCSVLESHNLRGLLPSLKGPYIYTAELVDLAFHLLIHDLFPIAEALGISVTKLASYRPAFDPSHLVIGTIKLLMKLLASMKGEDMSKRSIFYSKITKLHYQDVARRGVFEYDMSYGELCSISEAINQRAVRRTDQATSGMLQGPGIQIPEEIRNLKDVLQLTDQDIADRLDTPHPLTAYELVKIWKETPRPSVFNYRAALAHEIRRIKMPGLADEIIAGKYITEQTSLAFIAKMVKGLSQGQIRSLEELLQLSGEEDQWHTSTPFNEITKQIYDWVAGWTSGRKDSLPSKALALLPFTRTTAEKHRDLNDKLVKHGFLDLAREIMIIEQQLAR